MTIRPVCAILTLNGRRKFLLPSTFENGAVMTRERTRISLPPGMRPQKRPVAAIVIMIVAVLAIAGVWYLKYRGVIFSAIVAVSTFGLTVRASSASAQTTTTQQESAPPQLGVATLADAAMPTPLLFESATDCLQAAASVLPPKEAAKFCVEVRTLELKRGTKIAASAAKAQPDPCAGWLVPTWCTNGGYYGDGGVNINSPPVNITVPAQRTVPQRNCSYGGCPMSTTIRRR